MVFSGWWGAQLQALETLEFEFKCPNLLRARASYETMSQCNKHSIAMHGQSRVQMRVQMSGLSSTSSSKVVDDEAVAVAGVVIVVSSISAS